MKKLLSVLLALVLVAGIAFAGGGKETAPQQTTQPAAQPAPQAQPYTISVGGSTSVNPLMELLVAEYGKAHSNLKFNISATGSGDGIKGVPAGTCEIGMSSRELTPAELGTGVDVLVIAIDGIAVVSREPGSGTRGAFEEILKFQDQLVKGAIEFDGTGAIKAEVSRNVDAIGYISLGSLDNTIKALSVDGVAATTANVVSGSYKIARPFILLTKKGSPLNPETKAFLDWIMGTAGQNIVKTSWISVK